MFGPDSSHYRLGLVCYWSFNNKNWNMKIGFGAVSAVVKSPFIPWYSSVITAEDVRQNQVVPCAWTAACVSSSAQMPEITWWRGEALLETQPQGVRPEPISFVIFSASRAIYETCFHFVMTPTVIDCLKRSHVWVMQTSSSDFSVHQQKNGWNKKNSIMWCNLKFIHLK